MLTTAFAIVLLTTQATSPLEFGKQEVARAIADYQREHPTSAKRAINIVIRPSSQKEFYSITTDRGSVKIVGSDANGAMYGAFEFAERLKKTGIQAWSTKASGQPFLADRGLNLFLTLPWDYKKNNTDYENAALVDPNRWWFQNEDYWNTLLDLMAKSRLNWLDIHGAWDISVTNAPNLYAYFVTSPSFPKVGVPEEIKQANLRQLNHIVAMAHARGIRVSLMAYEANLKIPQNPNPGYQATETNIYKYTREVVEQTIRKVPGLDGIGFRIGESGRSESFFHCYSEAVKNSGRDIPLLTRSWITKKQKVLPLARASKDFTVEIKYNGEQWGAPYPIMGGRMANWYSYSFEDYFSDSGPENAAKMWPGQPTADGKHWPSEPYKIVWQVRANGTHRIFPFYNPEWTRRSIKSMPLGTTTGYTIEGEDAYFPKSPDYYLADSKDKYCNWIHQRDEMYWMCWGRLGYDPNVPDSVFDARAEELLGGDRVLVHDWKLASKSLSAKLMGFALGPDHRDHAPELEWGGSTEEYLHGQPFDTHVFLPVDEACANTASNVFDGRMSNAIATNYMHRESDFGFKIRGESGNPFSLSGMKKEVAFAVRMEDALSQYQSIRLISALGDLSDRIGPTSATRPGFFVRPYLEAVAKNTFYRPFTDRLRMHTNTFSWSNELDKLDQEFSRLNQPASGTSLRPRDINPLNYQTNSNNRPPSKLTWSSLGSMIELRFECRTATRAYALLKPLPSSTFFHRVPMVRKSGTFRLVLPRKNYGLAFAVEASERNREFRAPDVHEQTPYLVIPATPGPTPQIYNAAEATTFLKPEVITPQKYGAMLIGSRAWQFWSTFDRTAKRKLLEPVKLGLRLVILQEDFDRYKLDWMPRALRTGPVSTSIFDPAGVLGLEKVEAHGIMLQKFLPSPGWQIYGNAGLASMKYGKGEIWVTTARLMQNMHRPDAGKAFVRLLSLGGKEKPTVLIDSCSETAATTSSCHPDLMNSHDIPFLTLGEVIAKEQGMDSFTAVSGPFADDDVLGGRGPAMANAFLKGQVTSAAKLPIPSSMAAFEAERKRRKNELMRSLGLDPMPTKTPLNARVTGTIQRNGYKIEKLVFESRPKFYVTAYVYKSDTASTGRLPIIVNVNGHWAHKKGEDRLQLRSAFQAMQGYLAICIDTPGYSFEGNSLIERRPEGTHNDFALVQGGSNTTGYYVWDCMRALDYLATRSDTDMDRIGITGASGGGLATLFTFAADDRYRAAVPVVYMSSMELAPDNGCLCNHVPGTLQIGDKSDVIAIQAPKPVYIMGAQNDGEFPPDAMLLTHKKMQQSWSLFGKERDTFATIYAGGHDYNKPMREAMIGFFNRYLCGKGDGSPVPEPPIEVFNPEDRQFLVLDPPIAGERTMRDLSKEYLTNAPQVVSVADVFALNGGLPAKSDLRYKEVRTGSRIAVTFESEPGLTTPGVLFLPAGKPKGVRIYASDLGKQSEITFRTADDGYANLFIDVLCTGELAGIELRYPVYMGRSVAFTGGWQIARAAEPMRKYSNVIEVIGNGPVCSQAAMFAGLMEPNFAKVTGFGCLRRWEDVFNPGITPMAVQPRAHLCGTLDALRAKVKNGIWSFDSFSPNRGEGGR